MMKIIVNCGACEQFIAKCFASIRSQTFADWQAYVTLDPCGDGTFAEAVLARNGDPRIHITRNQNRLYSMINLTRAVERSAAAPDDIIVVLDGDDWFATPDALRIIDETYRLSGCWMTYGSWVADYATFECSQLQGWPTRADNSGLWPGYDEGTTDFRHTEWLATAVRTWKRWLWDLIDPRDFRDRNGNYFRVTEDQAVMLPMLEMSGTSRARHVAEVLMVYNRSNPHGCGRTCLEEMISNCDYIRTLPPYLQLPERPAPEAVSHLLSHQRLRAVVNHGINYGHQL
jgi:glycosyltransferase involved in cell wall biosynthesis